MKDNLIFTKLFQRKPLVTLSSGLNERRLSSVYSLKVGSLDSCTVNIAIDTHTGQKNNVVYHLSQSSQSVSNLDGLVQEVSCECVVRASLANVSLIKIGFFKKRSRTYRSRRFKAVRTTDIEDAIKLVKAREMKNCDARRQKP